MAPPDRARPSPGPPDVAPAGRRRTYRAHGRIGKYASQPAHIEIILKEKSEGVEKMDDDQERTKITKKQAARARFVKVGA